MLQNHLSIINVLHRIQRSAKPCNDYLGVFLQMYGMYVDHVMDVVTPYMYLK